jgi:hypothetical protein
MVVLVRRVKWHALHAAYYWGLGPHVLDVTASLRELAGVGTDGATRL